MDMTSSTNIMFRERWRRDHTIKQLTWLGNTAYVRGRREEGGKVRSDSLGSFGARLVSSTSRLRVNRRGALVRAQNALGSRRIGALGLALEKLVLVRVGPVVVGRAGELVLEVLELHGREDGRLVHDGGLVDNLVRGDDVVNDLVGVGLSLDDGRDLRRTRRKEVSNLNSARFESRRGSKEEERDVRARGRGGACAR